MAQRVHAQPRGREDGAGREGGWRGDVCGGVAKRGGRPAEAER